MAEDIITDAAASLKEARLHLEAQLAAIDAALDALGPGGIRTVPQHYVVARSPWAPTR